MIDDLLLENVHQIKQCATNVYIKLRHIVTYSLTSVHMKGCSSYKKAVARVFTPFDTIRTHGRMKILSFFVLFVLTVESNRTLDRRTRDSIGQNRIANNLYFHTHSTSSRQSVVQQIAEQLVKRGLSPRMMKLLKELTRNNDFSVS